MHLSHRVKYDGTKPFALLDCICTVQTFFSHAKLLHVSNTLIKCCTHGSVFGRDVAEGTISAVLKVEALLSCGGGWDVVRGVWGLQPQIMMLFQPRRVYLATVHYDVRAPATKGAE